MKTLMHTLMSERIALRAALTDNIRRATKPDPNYTREANAQRASEVRAQLLRDGNAVLAEHAQKAAQTAAQLKIAAAGERPHVDASSAADLIRTEQAWRNNVLPELERGRPLNQVLSDAAVDDVLGAERFAPAYYRSKFNSNTSLSAMQEGYDASTMRTTLTPAVQDLSFVDHAIADRFANMAPTSAAADLIRFAARADVDLATYRDVAASVDQGDAMGAQITIHLSAQSGYAAEPAHETQEQSATSNNAPADA
ncbi:hypothetical protein JGU71_14020 [Antrihabitans sp. YC3-6]|uniref:Uncharacterized protein n=1 Tax=Antrihabitans stalagmiti TaxID=2799499 RepID=A0A934NRJ5_9NOCA|nr:hypothetical protein [Antrihabitans stalagmiti]MBJ8340009.1 hypothetical protein [Antrihabitans stalagmiti]